MFARARASRAMVCTGLSALFLLPVAKAQSNYLVPLPQKGSVIALNNSGQVLYDTGLLTGNTFAAFPAGFTAPTGSPGILGESGVVAWTMTAGHLAIYSAGTVTDLGLPSWSQTVTPTAINASGQIVGISPGDFTSYSFLYIPGVFNPIHSAQLTDLPPPPYPTDINDSGQVVLYGFSTASPCRGFLISGGVLTDLGAVCPVAINASGEITGHTYDASGQHLH